MNVKITKNCSICQTCPRRPLMWQYLLLLLPVVSKCDPSVQAELNSLGVIYMLSPSLPYIFIHSIHSYSQYTHSSVCGVCSLVQKCALTESSRWSITYVSNSVSCTILTLFRMIQENKFADWVKQRYHITSLPPIIFLKWQYYLLCHMWWQSVVIG